MKNRILAMLLVVCMVISIVPTIAFAAEEAPALPTAAITELGKNMTVTAVEGINGSEEMETPLTFAMNFTAVEPSEEQYTYYKEWFADFVLTVNKDVRGVDGYLAGQYNSWKEQWIKIAYETEDVILFANEGMRIMGAAGLEGITYKDIVDFVKDFDCAIYFMPEFLEKNEDLVVTLELRMFNPENAEESYRIGELYSFTPEDAHVSIGDTSYKTVEDAVSNAQDNDVIELPSVENTEVQVSAAALEAVAQAEKNISLAIPTEKATVTLNKDAVALVANNEAEGEVKLVVEEVAAAEETTDKTYEITLTKGETPISNLGGYADVTVAYAGKNPVVYYVDGESKTEMEVVSFVNGLVTFRTPHFSTFLVTEGEAPAIPGAIITTLPSGMVVQAIDSIGGVAKATPTTFAMNFTAAEATEEQKAYYDKWYADFELVLNKPITGADAYLVGQYDAAGEDWVKLSFGADQTLAANTPLRVMYTFGSQINDKSTYINYNDILKYVKDFDCAIFFTPEYLQSNPDLEVTLELKIYNPHNMEESYRVGEAYTYTAASVPFGIVTQPTDQTVRMTGTATFTVGAYGAASYQWQRIKHGETEWTNIPGATSASYSVKVTSYTMLPYRCVLTDAEGNELITDEVTIALPDPLVNILNNPGNIHLIKNSIVSYHVELDNTEGVTYQWQRFKHNMWINVSYQGNQSDTVTFTAASWAQFPFRCVITDANGTKIYTENYTYTLEEPPVQPAIISNPKDVYLLPGEIATFTVEAVGAGVVENGVDTGLTYQWWRSRDGGATFGEYTDPDQGYAHEINVHVWAGQEYLYFCEVKDGYGNTMKTTVVKPILITAVNITSQPTDAVVDAETGKATVSVACTGNVKTYQWQRLKPTGWVNVTNATTYVGNDTATMSTGVTGTFRCRITDMAGNVIYTNQVVISK